MEVKGLDKIKDRMDIETNSPEVISKQKPDELIWNRKVLR